jgi:hypothetical protein
MSLRPACVRVRFPKEKLVLTSCPPPVVVTRGGLLGMVARVSEWTVLVQVDGPVSVTPTSLWACLPGHLLVPAPLAGPKGRLP